MDFEVQAPLYRLLRGIQDELLAEERSGAPRDEW